MWLPLNMAKLALDQCGHVKQIPLYLPSGPLAPYTPSIAEPSPLVPLALCH